MHPHSEAVAADPKRGQIILAVVLAGMLPTVLNVLLKALFVVSDFLKTVPMELLPFFIYTYLAAGFLIRMASLPCGVWAGLVAPVLLLRGYATLGLLAGLVALFVDWVCTKSFEFMSEPFTIFDYLFALSTAIFFISGGLFAEVWKKHKMRKTVSSVEEETGRSKIPTLRVVEIVGPLILTFIGIVVDVFVSFA